MQDPFDERRIATLRKRVSLLGAVFEFESGSARLLRLVDQAYKGLAVQHLSRTAPRLKLRLQLTDGGRFAASEPPPLHTHGGAGLLLGTIDAANFAALCPATRTGLVACSRELLRFPYHARYELLEFAVFTLGSRAQGLVPLHAGCVALQGRGALLIGDSGAGKSTLALHCLLAGLDFVAEDAVFVSPKTLRAEGVANFLHLREDSLRFIDSQAMATRIRRSPVIRRRSGEAKFEIDMRRGGYRLAAAPPMLAALVLVSKKPARGGALLRPLSAAQTLAKLAASQPYAAGPPGLRALARQAAHLPAFELRRGVHPAQSARALRKLLEWGQALA